MGSLTQINRFFTLYEPGLNCRLQEMNPNTTAYPHTQHDKTPKKTKLTQFSPSFGSTLGFTCGFGKPLAFAFGEVDLALGAFGLATAGLGVGAFGFGGTFGAAGAGSSSFDSSGTSPTSGKSSSEVKPASSSSYLGGWMSNWNRKAYGRLGNHSA